MTARRFSLFAVLATLLAPAAAHADTSISSLAGPTPVRSWAGTAVLSVLDPGTHRYSLSVMRSTGLPQPVPGIASAHAPFDADIGPGPGGGALIVYARCQRPGSCHLFRTTPAGLRETPIVGATSTGGSESAPTVWGQRLAFVRTYPRGSSRVYVRPLGAPATVRSTRLPGVPLRVCEDRTPCRAITDGRVPELELRGTTLAESVRFGLVHAGICGDGQIRLVDLLSHRNQKVADSICGLSGQTWIGLSLTASQLLFAQICPGDPGGCRGHGTIAYRYTPRNGSTETALQPDVLSGFAATDARHALEVREQRLNSGPTGTSELVLAGPLRFGPKRRRSQ